MTSDLARTLPVQTTDFTLVDLLPDDAPFCCWIRKGDGIVGIGQRYAETFSSASEAASWWAMMSASCEVSVDETLSDEPMAGPIAFLSFPFTPEGHYEMVVPEIIVGRRNDTSWMTSWNGATRTAPTSSPTPPPPLTFETHSLSESAWKQAVRTILDHLSQGHADKVVLARDEIAHLSSPIDLRWVVSQLADQYPQTWTYCVKGLVGATPELLVRRDRGLVTSRVLAGTIHGNADPSQLATTLAHSAKDLAEHEYAVDSVAQALRPHVTNLHVPEVPFVLNLPNVMHLASDITGAAKPESSVLDLAWSIHPSAAVCGTPTASARGIIEEVEHLDRGRYAGPVGWVNARGDGEIGIALRCGMFTDSEVRIFAGAGIVDGSDPQAEWDETRAKLAPMKQALSPHTA